MAPHQTKNQNLLDALIPSSLTFKSSPGGFKVEPGLKTAYSVQEKHNPDLNQSSGNEERKKRISGRNNRIYGRLNDRKEEASKVSRVKTLK